MKKLLIVVLFAVLVMGIDAQSTNRTWDKFFNEGSTNPAILYDGYTPNFNNYNEINMQSAIDIVTSFEKNKKSFDGYYLSTNLIVEEINNKNIRVNASGRWITHNNNLPPELENNNYVTIWYRGITRSGKSSKFVIDKVEITGKYVRKPTTEEIAEAEKAEKRKAIEEGYKNPVFTGTVASFVREYKENSYAFEAKYYEKIVQLTGVITGFNKGYESYFGITTGRAIYEVSIEGGYCFWFNQDELPEEVFLSFKKGQTITVVGQVPKGGGGYFGHVNGKLDNCRFVR